VARFASKDESLDLSAIHQVAIGKYGNDRVNTYVRVEYGVGDAHVAYLRDGRWSGLGDLFTGSNLRLARAIAACAT
jgi:hypothetical protein